MANRRDFTNKNTIFTGTSGIEIPQGSAGQRPGSPALGTLRYNSDNGLPEFYTSTGWAGVDAPPTVTNISGTINENTDSTITITGSGFKNGAVVSITGAAVSNVERQLVTTYVNTTTLTAATAATSANYVGGAVFTVKVTNPSLLAGELVNAGYIDRDPVFTTPAGSLGTYSAPGTGGTIFDYSSGGTTYRVHTFYDSDTFALSSNTTCDILLLGGGGGGHGGYQSPGGGGGGAGGLVYYASKALTTGSYTVTVGNGGVGGYSDSNSGSRTLPTSGGNTSFTGLTTAIGGGRGAGYDGDAGEAGGSGGGGSYPSVNAGYAGTANQGNSGGTGGNGNQNGGGGGGAGGSGGNSDQTNNTGAPGAGGQGVVEGSSTVYNFTNGSTATFNINGLGYVYAGGGGGGMGYHSDSTPNLQRAGGGTGGSNTLMVGGSGGHNYGAALGGAPGQVHRGAGGGGGGGVVSAQTSCYGGNGGKGIAIVRYALSASTTAFTVSASDPESTSVTYSLASGSLPGGMTIASNGQIQGFPTTTPASNTTYSFSVNATSAGQTSSRSFSIIVPTRPADPGPGGGYSIAQGANGTDSIGFTTTSMTKYETNTKNQGSAGLDIFNYTTGTFSMHTGHDRDWYPTSVAINVTSDTYGKVLNQIQWYKHANSCGNVDVYGSNRSITSGNYTDLSNWTHLGRFHARGPGSGDENGVMTFGFNPQGYGYKWYMIQVVDASYISLPYPQVGHRAGWANYGMRLNCHNLGGDGSSSVNAALNGIAIRDRGLASGYYWIKPYGETARYCYVDNTNYGGGWVLVQTVGSNTNYHWNQTGDYNLYDNGTTNMVPFSGTGYSTTDGRRYADSFVQALGHGGGGEGVFRLEIARSGAGPTSNNTLTNGTDYKCAQFVRMDNGMKYYASSNNGGLADVALRSYDIAHYYPYDSRWEAGNAGTNAQNSGASGHFQVYNSSYKVFDGHSNPSSISSSLYSSVRFLWGYTGATGNGIYGGGTYAFSLNGDTNPGYMWIR